MPPDHNPFIQLRAKLDTLGDTLRSTQSATLQEGQGADNGKQVLLYTQIAPQGNAILWLDSSLGNQDPQLTQALLQMHNQIHRATAQLRF